MCATGGLWPAAHNADIVARNAANRGRQAYIHIRCIYVEPGKCREVKLTVNYRSAPEIVDFYNKWMTDYANDFFAWNGLRIDKTIVPCDGKMKKEKTSPVLSLAGDSVDEWCNKVYCFLVSLKDEGKIINYNQVAFLFRSVTNEKAKLLANYLEEKGIPVYSPRSKMFFE